ncbi:MAG: flagellar basal body P-ring formation protein FlgA [Sphingomonadaceae bacterium]|nr:flagellar basal body P-ring formation protein FlgA [Sphingomonadaceae bacterium]
MGSSVRAAILLAMAAMASPATAMPGQFEDIGTLEARVVAALDAEIGAPGGPVAPIDRRLKLAPCPSPATIDPPALGAVAVRCQQLGWRIRVPLRLAGQQTAAMAAQPVAGPPLVRRGDPVELIAQGDGLTVSTQAVAQEDGSAGAHIRVKTDAKSPIIVGEVMEMGKVRIISLN